MPRFRLRTSWTTLCGLLLALSPSASVAVTAQADVIIYGANAAGVAAAVQTARMGRTVILLEPGRFLGGMTTGGLGATDTGAKEAVGGIARDFYHRIFQHYHTAEAWKYETREEYVPKHRLAVSEDMQLHWFFEPQVAARFLRELLTEAGVEVIYQSPLDRSPGGVRKEGGRIVSIRTVDGREFAGQVFIDTSYEGDLMAAAGASYTVGREANSRYNETLNGIVYLPERRTAHIDPYVVKGDPSSGLLPRVLPGPPGPEGEGDHRTQAYNFRVTLTDEPTNRVEFTEPAGYDPIKYELVLRHMQGRPGMLPGNQQSSGLFTLTPMPNRKTDSNNRNLFSTDYIGANWDYPEGSYEERAAIVREHENYTRGLFWFLVSDPRVPADVQAEVRRWGLPADEFTDNHNWPTQMYVREARRLQGEYVVTEHDCLRQRFVDDPIGQASYAMDSHCVSMFVNARGKVQLEGAFFKSVRPYPIGLRSLLPRREEVQNLLVPVCLSASHVAYGSIRMEPVFMILAQSAATAAALSLDLNVDLHDLPYAELRARLLADGQILGPAPAARAAAQPAPSRFSPPPAAAPAPVATPTPPAAPAPEASPAPGGLPVDRELATILVRLEQLELIDEKVYWYVHARRNQQCDGAKVGAVIIAAAARYEPVADLNAALELLVKRRVLTKADYWSRMAVPGNSCSGGQVRSLLSRLSTTIR